MIWACTDDWQFKSRLAVKLYIHSSHSSMLRTLQKRQSQKPFKRFWTFPSLHSYINSSPWKSLHTLDKTTPALKQFDCAAPVLGPHRGRKLWRMTKCADGSWMTARTNSPMTMWRGWHVLAISAHFWSMWTSIINYFVGNISASTKAALDYDDDEDVEGRPVRSSEGLIFPKVFGFCNLWSDI